MNGGGNEDTINLYFVDGGEVPYVSLTEYMPRIGTLYENDDMGLPGVTYEITHPDAIIMFLPDPITALR